MIFSADHKIIMKGGVGLVGAFCIGLFLYGKNNDMQDPLYRFLDSSAVKQHSNNALNADFFTTRLYPYQGPISEGLQLCMDSLESSETGFVYARADLTEIAKMGMEREDRTLTLESIREEIKPVFGSAIASNPSLNWKWISDDATYIFFVNKGDEAFWKCYFENETEFFSRFFSTVTFNSVNILSSTSTSEIDRAPFIPVTSSSEIAY